MTSPEDEVTFIPAIRWIVRRPSNGTAMGSYVSRLLADRVATRWGGVVVSNLADASTRGDT